MLLVGFALGWIAGRFDVWRGLHAFRAAQMIDAFEGGERAGALARDRFDAWRGRVRVWLWAVTGGLR